MPDCGHGRASAGECPHCVGRVPSEPDTPEPNDDWRALRLSTMELWGTSERLRKAGHIELADRAERLSNDCGLAAREQEVTQQMPVRPIPK